MSQSTRDQQIGAINLWKSRMQRMDAAAKQLCDLLGCSLDSTLLDAAYAAQTGYTQALEKTMGDKHGTLQWWWEADGFGASGVGYLIDGKRVKTTSAADVLRVIEDTNK